MSEKLGLSTTILLVFLAGIGVLSAVALGIMTVLSWIGVSMPFWLAFIDAIGLALLALIFYVNGAKEVDADDDTY
jgi:hypothetical protein